MLGGALGTAFLAFPLLVLGLSGFETGVSMMPLIRRDGDDDEDRLRSRIAHTRTLLTVAAVIMSGYLITTSLITTVLVPPAEFAPGGQANGRALAYLAHELLGNVFGTAYDISSILILWFAGASAMAGLINIVPRYLPGYGMAPEWARAVRPVVLVYTALADRDHHPVPGRRGRPGRRVRHRHPGHDGVRGVRGHRGRAPASAPRAAVGFGVVALLFGYALIDNIVEKPDGIVISLVFIAGIVGHLAGLPDRPDHRAARRPHRVRRAGRGVPG